MNETSTVEDLLAEMYSQAKAQFGSAVKAYWFHPGEVCPGCQRTVDTWRHKDGDALSLNAFIYRERGVLIGYLLCEQCAKYIFRAAKKNPYQQTPLHTTIEQSLIAAYQRYMASLDA